MEIRPTEAEDLAQISDLHRKVSGPGRFAKSAYRIRENVTTSPSPCCRVGWVGEEIAAAVTMNAVTIGGVSGAMLLGPLVVAPQFAGQGRGQPMVSAALEAARANGVQLVVLVGDNSYYTRFGFEVVPPGQITLPGPVDPARVLAVELTPNALAHFSGLIAA